jgi:riboflavin synthase
VFTGIIEEVGRIRSIEPVQGGREIAIEAHRVLEGTALGDSIAIDGACHTVIHLDTGVFVVQSVATTLARTTFGEFEAGRGVNLERAVAVGQRLGGHMVQGHVDGVGRVLSVQRRGEHVVIDIEIPDVVADVSIPLGSITLNGISLTINAIPEPNIVQVSIIPHTWEVTAVPDLAPGMRVNLEGDLIGKYVRHLLDRGRAAASDAPPSMHNRDDPGY